MFIIIGLIVLLGAVTVGVAGVQANTGSDHTLAHGFTVFDHTYGGSTGLLFAYGILIGAIGTCGLIILLAGTWTMSRRGVVARRELRHSRREMAAARKEFGKATPAAKQPAAQPPRQPVVPMAGQATPKPAWSFNKFLNRSAPAPKPETAAKAK
ncbi:hypothetical protein ACIP5Y_38890 [Nocardia sp. NPDC088792]|uniref:hypothetical protein n=1 Tax=Nocardia sp. NPDC088792 TaxID=3364332 RepID=UPI003806C820